MTNEKTKADYFTPANADLKHQTEHLSPSGKYKLVITPYGTGPGTWSYTQGLIYNIETGQQIAEIQRNYSSFPFLWIEDHPNGKSYFIGGEDYQGQTVIELDTGLRKNFLPEAAAKGHGFCWAEYEFNAVHQIVSVNGCYWACPYEFKLYDFSDPMNKGWTELDDAEGTLYCYSEAPKPAFNEDGTITFFEARSEVDEEGEDIYDEETNEIKKYVVASKTYKREGSLLVLDKEWIDPAEVIKRAEEKAQREAREAAWELYKKTDPRYLAVMASFGDPSYGFVKRDYCVSTGVCYDGWSPDFKEKDSLVCVDLVRFHKLNGHEYTIGIEWGKEKAPIKLETYIDHKKMPDQWFERDQIQEALAAAKAILAEKPSILGRLKDFVKSAQEIAG